jgi:peptide/nickel transport system substrate-binding protein
MLCAVFPRRGSRLARLVAPVATAFVMAAAGIPAAATDLAKGEPTGHASGTRHAIAMHGEPLHGPGFAHFAAVDPAAPKGGRLAQGVLGTFDSLNPFIVLGVPAAGVRDLVSESLLTRGLDEPFTLYGLLARGVDMPDNRSEVTFELDPNARFSDGTPVTVDDVVFSFEVLREKGRPNHRSYFQKVAKVERPADGRVRFVFADGNDRELPLILGLMPIMSSKALTPATFDQTRLDTFLGSGPYRIARVDPGRSIVYARNPDWWAKDLAVARGRFNFDEVRYEYFRDASTMFEAFRSGALDLRFEDDPGQWSQGYDFAAVRDGQIIKSEPVPYQPAGMMALAFNTRRPVFADPRVRAALIQAYDFEFANRTLFNGLFTRTQSFFERSELSSMGRAADPEERRLLAPFTGAVRADVLDGSARLPATDGSGRNRANQAKALALLAEAGFKSVGGKLVDAKTGQPLVFEILVNSVAAQRIVSAFRADLERIGVQMTVRQVEGTQYQARLRTYDYDMILTTWPSSLSPGNEQTFRWSGRIGREDGSFNFAGVDNPAADAMIDAMLAARDRGPFVSAVRALDRVLRSGDYVIPLHHAPRHWIAHKRQVRMPPRLPVSGLTSDVWWWSNAP